MKVSIKIPKVGLTIEEVVFTEWTQDCGSKVEFGETIAIVESDKANFEIPAPTNGTLVETLCEVGQTIAVGEVIGVLES